MLVRLCNLEDQIVQQTGWGVELIRAKKIHLFLFDVLTYILPLRPILALFLQCFDFRLSTFDFFDLPGTTILQWRKS